MHTKKDIFFIPFNLEKKIYRMNEKFIFNYSYSDGFTYRLLSINLLVDLDFNCFLKFESCEEIPLLNGQRFLLTFNSKLPKHLEENLKQIIDNLNIKESKFNNEMYEGAADIQSYRFIYGDLSVNTLTYLYSEIDKYYYDLDQKQEKIRMKLEQDIIKWTSLFYEQVKKIYSKEYIT